MLNFCYMVVYYKIIQIYILGGIDETVGYV